MYSILKFLLLRLIPNEGRQLKKQKLIIDIIIIYNLI